MKVLRGFMPALNKFVVVSFVELQAEQKGKAQLRVISALASAQNT